MKYFNISKNSLDLELNLQILIIRHMKKLMYLPLFALFVACAAPAEEAVEAAPAEEEVTAVEEAPVEEAPEADSTAAEADSTAVEVDSTAAEATEDHSGHDHDHGEDH